MYADDRVLVGVVRNQRDLRQLLQQQEYRIPLQRIPAEDMEYLAFFLNGQLRRRWLRRQQSKLNREDGALRSDGAGAICYFAEVRGYELAYRRHLSPQEPDHPRASDLYHLYQLGQIRELNPPIVNRQKRRFSFIRTRWGQFTTAKHIGQLYRPPKEGIAEHVF